MIFECTFYNYVPFILLLIGLSKFEDKFEIISKIQRGPADFRSSLYMRVTYVIHVEFHRLSVSKISFMYLNTLL